MGIDGLSFPMILLTALLCFIGIFASWNINKAQKGYFSLFLLLETGMIGSFVALDFFMFLHFLGSYAAADVFSYRYLGRREA